MEDFDIEIAGMPGPPGPEGPAVADGDKGDVVIAAGAWTIDPALLTAFMRTVTAAANAAAARTALGIVIGTDAQAHDADLDAIAALATTSFGRGLLILANAAALRTAAALGTTATLDT